MDAKESWRRPGGGARDPDDPLQALQNGLSRIFGELADRIGSSFDPLAEMRGEFVPAVDLIEDADSLQVTIELPGMSEQDVDVSLAQDVLTLRGEKPGGERERKGVHRRERRFGHFSRTLTLPCQVDADRVSATFGKGVLTVTLPKQTPPEAKSRRIKVESE